jgi:dTDP-4-dehydrorhamnose reductase/4-ketoreductase
VIGLDNAALGITSPEAVGDAFAEHRPGAVVCRTAHTAVNGADTGRERPLGVNAEGPGLSARAAAGQGARLLHVSPGHAVSGQARTTPAPETREPAPGTACGRTRPVRPYSAHGRGPARTVTGFEARRDTVDVVDDQCGQPTRSTGVAERTAGPRPRIGRDASGALQAAGSGGTTWYDPAREVLRLLGAGPGRIPPAGGAVLVRPAPRPAHSAPAHGRRQHLGLPPLRDRRSALHKVLPRIRKESPA